MTSPHAHHVPPMHVIAGVGVGVLIAIQSRVNGDLGSAVGDPVTAAVISFTVGMAMVIAIVAARPEGRRAWARIVASVRSGRTRPWELGGGLIGAAFVAQQSGIVPVLGVALFSVAVVGGATTGSLLVDRWGVGPAGRREISALRVTSALLATVGVAIAATGDSGDRRASLGLTLVLVGIAASMGALTALQGALNGRVSVVAGDTFVATTVNFLVGLAALLVAWVVMHLVVRVGMPSAPPPPWEEPHVWLGGPVGLAFIAASAYLVRTIGVLVLGLANVLGQVAGALALDVLAPTGGEHLTAALLIGSAITVVAVVVGTMRPRRAPAVVSGGPGTSA